MPIVRSLFTTDQVRVQRGSNIDQDKIQAALAATKATPPASAAGGADTDEREATAEEKRLAMRLALAAKIKADVIAAAEAERRLGGAASSGGAAAP